MLISIGNDLIDFILCGKSSGLVDVKGIKVVVYLVKKKELGIV